MRRSIGRGAQVKNPAAPIEERVGRAFSALLRRNTRPLRGGYLRKQHASSAYNVPPSAARAGEQRVASDLPDHSPARQSSRFLQLDLLGGDLAGNIGCGADGLQFRMSIGRTGKRAHRQSGESSPHYYILRHFSSLPCARRANVPLGRCLPTTKAVAVTVIVGPR